ncbi:cat eye syndrome critical region protein 5-like [Scleropages formosus]|uniref:Cat eye syndrome critical region protein 5-like n=1 Tax=Scleropages formosus TaxID=113540 RepID=A0A0P7Z2T7_SCLFO|nr:cat eye syndrome critical region protein 5-like [Scleropages formosus]
MAELQPGFGLLFDIDGVLVRGRTPIPAAKKAFQKLVNPQGQFVVPVVFVTNAGNCLRQTKADQLSHLLGVSISQDQVVMSHSPLKMFKKYHEKCVLVSGQGPVLDIAKNVGFSNVVSIDMVRESFPLLDMVDHNRRPKVPVSRLCHLTPLSPDTFLQGDLPCEVFTLSHYSRSTPIVTIPKIEGKCRFCPLCCHWILIQTNKQSLLVDSAAVVLFGEPIRWETNLQLIIDILLTDGNLGNAHQNMMFPHLPLLACNMDLMWMAEAHSPRFGHGTFLVCLENIYKKITGKEMKYEALVGKPSEVTYHYAEHLIREQAAERKWRTPIRSLYAIGDNLMTDIYGANLYNRYLEERAARKRSKAVAKMAAVTGSSTALAQVDDTDSGWESELSPPSATCCKSVLVCTGVYRPHAEAATNGGSCLQQMAFHGHRDFCFDPALVEPGHIVEDVDAAVELIFEQEKFVPQ